MLEASPDPGLWFDLEVVVADRTHTVAVSGELDLAAARRFDDVVTAALDAAPDTVIVDLGGARFIDSTGIRMLVEAHRRAAVQDVRLAIVPAPEPVQSVFRMCGLDSVLPFVREAAT